MEDEWVKRTACSDSKKQECDSLGQSGQVFLEGRVLVDIRWEEEKRSLIWESFTSV